MKARLRPGTCYMAGLTRREAERNAVGIATGLEELEQRFIEIAIKEFKIEPNKIIIEELGSIRRIYFYHSRVARQLAEIRSREDKLFKVRNEFSMSYVAGILDAAGRFSKQGIYIDQLTPQDEVMLANLGIHTRNGRVSNISSLIELTKRYSTLIKKQLLTK